jgi:hypothetical protein
LCTCPESLSEVSLESLWSMLAQSTREHLNGSPFDSFSVFSSFG